MIAVFMAQWMKERRSPLLLLAFCGISILLTLMFGGLSVGSKLEIGVFAETSMDRSTAGDWMDRLNGGTAIRFYDAEEKAARQAVREGRADAAVMLMEDDFRIVAGSGSRNARVVEQHVRSVYEERLVLEAAGERTGDPERLEAEVAGYLAAPPLSLSTVNLDGGEWIRYRMDMQLLFGFTLFMAIFTIGFKVNAIAAERVSGIWNRVILSPVTKIQMYAGHLLYSLIIGTLQITVVLALFRYAFGYEMKGAFLSLAVVSLAFSFTMVAVAMLFSGFVRTPEQFTAIFMSIIPIIPMLSGVYFPPGTISHPAFLAAAELMPLTHALRATLDIAVYDAPFTQWLPSLAKLLLTGVLLMGIGINLMERRTG